jgi:uncharacterized coiled-coil protein SlyX
MLGLILARSPSPTRMVRRHHPSRHLYALRLFRCREWDLNPHGRLGPGGFKPPMSTIPSSRLVYTKIPQLLEAQTEIASVHRGFAIRSVSTSPLGRTSMLSCFLMITDQDITKLKEVFATKDDLKGFATKEALCALDARVERLEMKVDGITEEVGDLKVGMGELNDKMDEMHSKMDRFLGNMDALQQDGAAGAVIFARHSRQIKSLAVHTGATLSD